LHSFEGRLAPIVYREADDIIDEIGPAPLDLVKEILRLENKVNIAYQMANHFDGNGNVIQSNGRPFPQGPVDHAWIAAGRMLKGALANCR
jgi:hypothetical protein